MVLNATFNNISAISWQSVFVVKETWQSVLLVEETEVPGENRRPATSHGQTVTTSIPLTHIYMTARFPDLLQTLQY